MTEVERLIADWLADLPAYCRSALQIQTKDDSFQYARLNPVQKALFAALDACKREMGNAYALVCKARQMGCSTGIALRFFAHAHLAHPDNPLRVYILSHDDKSARKLLRMYATMWERHEPALRVGRRRSNEHMMELDNGSVFETNTASTPTGGRGGTITRFHGSELAYWSHAEAHAMGSMQQMAKLPGVEMVLESTANGASGAFYERWRSAELGHNEFLPLFFPWTMMPEYTATAPMEYRLSSDAPNDVMPSEIEYAEKHQVSRDQMWWRNRKIAEFSADGSDGALRFGQEFPISAQEAFLGGSGASFIGPAIVEAARLRHTSVVGDDAAHPLVMGLDPAPAHGSASSAVVWRRGRVCYRIERWHGLDPETLAMRIYDEFMRARAERLCVDESEGVGHHVVTHLSRLSGTAGKVVGVRFGNKAHDPTLYANARAEIWSKMAKWLADGGAIPDELPGPGQASLASELLAPRLKSGGERRVLLESKDQMAQRGVASPDGADALAVTFHYPDPPKDGVSTWTAPGPFDKPGERPHTPWTPFGPDGNVVADAGYF